jgi:hypothetical protein
VYTIAVVSLDELRATLPTWSEEQVRLASLLNTEYILPFPYM